MEAVKHTARRRALIQVVSDQYISAGTKHIDRIPAGASVQQRAVTARPASDEYEQSSGSAIAHKMM